MRGRAPIAALVVALVAVVELMAHFQCASRAPALHDYAALAEPVAALHQPGDLVTVAPAWAEPMVRHALGDGLMPLAAVARPDATTFDHAVLVSVRGARSPELEGWVVREERELGPFTIARLENPSPVAPTYDFVSGLGPAVEVSAHGTRCMWNPRARVEAGGLGGHPTWPRQRFECGPPRLSVGVTVISDEGFHPRRCLWAPPPARGELLIRFRDVPLGERIVGHAGLDWMTERARGGAPIELRVDIDGEPLGTIIHADGDGWAAFELPTRRGTGTVSFAVSAPDDEGRDFCFEARSQ